jgi:hypothetical protein
MGVKVENRIELLMQSLNKFYENKEYIQKVIEISGSDISKRLLDWFVTNYCKKYTIILDNGERGFHVYQNYRLLLKSYSKDHFDPFCRTDKILFQYGEEDDQVIETSCGQLCFFRWCFQNNIFEYVE